MPSIPQSLLWISLVVLWLFVLVPMLISKRDAVRRTSDVALATRVVNGGDNSRLIRRSGPAAGHRSDPDWKPEPDEGFDAADSLDTEVLDRDRGEEEDVDTNEMAVKYPVAVKVAVTEPAEPDYLDVDVVEDSAALPASESAAVAESAVAHEAVGKEAPAEDEGAEQDKDDLGDRYEYVEDSSGLEPAADDESMPVASAASRRRRLDSNKAAAVSARKYAFRKRVLMVLAVILVSTATAGFEVSATAWWLCGTATFGTLLYLWYLRRQTKIEEKVRRRRAQRMARARLGVVSARDRDRDYGGVPSRLRRPGAVVLEIDDEDPIFEHLENAMAMRTFGWPRDLPRAVGE